jgi:hypothetical protein
MWNERQMFAAFEEHYNGLLSITSPVRYRPSRSMHWRTRFITLPITRTWQVTWHFFVQTHRFVLCQSAELPDTLFFSNCPARRSHKPKDRANELAEKCRYFWKSLKSECAVDSRPQLHDVTKWRPLAEPTANLVSCSMRGCPSAT